MPILSSRMGSFFAKPYWAIKRHDGSWLCELDRLDWTLDIVTTGDILRASELWMFCPRTQSNPKGSTATIRLRPEEKGCAFYFKRALISYEGRFDHMIIGKVLDRHTGDCEVFIWDDVLKVMSLPIKNNVNYFSSWRVGVSDIGPLSHEVIGLKL